MLRSVKNRKSKKTGMGFAIDHNTRQPKVAAINDLTGFGRCSLAVSLPIISAMGLQCCPLPTAVLSAHTGFDGFHFLDTTDQMPHFIRHWKELSLSFAGIYSGFLGSCHQAELVLQFLDAFDTDQCFYCCDPVMGDNGKAYATCDMALQQEMRRLVAKADLITPNLTEACMLTDTPYATDFSQNQLQQMALKLSEGKRRVVITGIQMGDYVGNLALDGKTGSFEWIMGKHLPSRYSGCGDVFASVLVAAMVKQTDFFDAVKKASKFTERAIALSRKAGVPTTDGVCFEPLLDRLT